MLVVAGFPDLGSVEQGSVNRVLQPPGGAAELAQRRGCRLAGCLQARRAGFQVLKLGRGGVEVEGFLPGGALVLVELGLLG